MMNQQEYRYPSNHAEASVVDNAGEYYAEFTEDCNDWSVFGSETGFCYASYSSQEEAVEDAKWRNKMRNKGAI